MTKRYVMLVDMQLCTGCNTCSVACKQENNLPVDVAYHLGADIVIAVDVMASATDTSFSQILGEKPLLPGKIKDMVTVLGDSLYILIKEQYQTRLREHPPAFLLKPNIPPRVSIISGYNQASELIQEGVTVTEPILPELKQQLKIED